jgi:hypothetical protein
MLSRAERLEVLLRIANAERQYREASRNNERCRVIDLGAYLEFLHDVLAGKFPWNDDDD